MRYSKMDIIKWVKANDRWPKQTVKEEWSMYDQMRRYRKADWTFSEEIKWFKDKNRKGNPTGNKGKLKGVKHGLSKEWIKLAEFLMDSGGTGAF